MKMGFTPILYLPRDLLPSPPYIQLRTVIFTRLSNQQIKASAILGGVKCQQEDSPYGGHVTRGYWLVFVVD